jgi:hypothetical protein
VKDKVLVLLEQKNEVAVRARYELQLELTWIGHLSTAQLTPCDKFLARVTFYLLNFSVGFKRAI